jgi:hypothetical protein
VEQRTVADRSGLLREGVRCIAALWRVKSLLRHRSDRPKRRLTTDQMAFVAGHRMLLYRSQLAGTHTPARRHI